MDRTEPSQLGTTQEGLIESRVKRLCPRSCSWEGGQPLGRARMIALARLTNVTKHNLVLTTRSICSLTQCNVVYTWRKQEKKKWENKCLCSVCLGLHVSFLQGSNLLTCHWMQCNPLNKGLITFKWTVELGMSTNKSLSNEIAFVFMAA